jgi:zinc/manganese transport system substrate-binding protein
MSTKMKKYLVAILILTYWLIPRPAECGQALKVLTTHTVLRSITEEVGKEHVNVTCLATGKEDPHAIQAKPSYMVAARNADLFIKIGMELELGYEQLVIDGARNPKIRPNGPGYLDASLHVLRREVPNIKVDRSMGDVHPLGNPHYWLDPYNVRMIADEIAQRLALLDPSNRADYESNCADFKKRLDTAMFGPQLIERLGSDRLWSLDTSDRLNSYLKDNHLEDTAGGWYRELAPLKGLKVIEYHRSLVYFADRFGLDLVAELEPKPGIPPSPSHLISVVEAAQRQQARIILMEPFYNRKAADFVAEKTGAKVVEVTPAVGGQPGVDDYFSLIDNMIRKIKEAAQSAPPEARQES